MKKKFTALVIAVICFATVLMTVWASDVSYTFSGVNCITDGSTAEIADKPLTDKITVTTSGEMNRKYAAVTDLAHNNEVGTFPANKDFTAKGSYIYLGAASSNDNAVITLNLPKIEKGSKVTLTFAKPTVTNNGSTLRNTNDPYAYFKIGDRYISINGDNFDKWRTEAVVIGEDTETIEFHCDKWGAAAIEKIEITKGDNSPLHNLNITSTQYANLTVNGIKFCADENGKLTVPSLPENEVVKITAVKDGYKTEEKEVKINGDTEADIPLTCETDAVYYESDFGNSKGAIVLDGEYKIGEGIDTKEVTKLSANVTFTENGYMTVNTDKGEALTITYKDGIYIGDKPITSKDNMEFYLTFDKDRNLVVCSQNSEFHKLDEISSDFEKITSVSGKNVTLDYIGVSYPDTSKIIIVGPDKVSSLDNGTNWVTYSVELEYRMPNMQVEYYVLGNEGINIYPSGNLCIDEKTQGKATICAEYNGHKTYKEIEIIKKPKIIAWEHNGYTTVNLKSRPLFIIKNIVDECGNMLDTYGMMERLKDFKSSDENVIKIDENGIMTAVGKGKAVISANAYTGSDNPISVEYTVDQFYIGGITESDISYTAGELIENENISSYKITYEDGTAEEISETEIPAYESISDGSVITASYDLNGTLVSVVKENVKAGGKIPVSNGNKQVYLCADSKISKITEANTVMNGYKIEHKAGVKYEIAPVYTFKNVGDVKDEGKTLDAVFDSGLYNITFKKAQTQRGDIYVNGFMVGNNVDQSDADRKVTYGALYTAEDIKVKDGKITVSMCDGSTMLDYVTVEKQPEFYERPPRIYVIGDSLACEYYGEFEKEVGGGRSGWGQQLENFVNIPVTNLANSGQFAAGLYQTAFPSVIENGFAGDIALIECAYNDRNYSTREEMTKCVHDMILQCRNKGIIPVLVTPNASEHDYKPSVAWSSYLKDIAIDSGCSLIDLSKESYDILYELYGDNANGAIKKNFNLTEVGGDNLHSSYAGANVWASIVAEDLQEIVKNKFVNYKLTTDFEYTFTDTEGNTITAKVK